MKDFKNFFKRLFAQKNADGFTEQKKMNMSKPQYFYFISGLPGISITETGIPFTAKDFLAEVKNNIEEKDFALVCWLYYPRDNHNLLSILFSKNNIQQTEGCYSLQELEKGIEGDVKLPDYMNAFISSYKEKQKPLPRYSMGAKLTEAYFKKKQSDSKMILNEWIEFELS